ncbi:MAG: chorismate synthase [Clostridia bacterium]|nr:chorismate synthase [Clostridia bacterium]
MSSFFGNHLKLSLFGQSHGEAIGMTMDGFPAGMKIDMDRVLFEMARRAPGKNRMSTPRKEADAPEILSGVLNGVTTGQPLTAIIRNTNQHSADYGDGVDLARPGHADYTGHVRYFGFEDWRGGGHFSGRITAPLVFAGAFCMQYLEQQGIGIYSHIARLGNLQDDAFDSVHPGQYDALKHMTLPTLQPGLSEKMEQEIIRASEKQDSIGGVVECMATGLPAGLGAPFFDSVESILSHLLFSVPAVKGVEFGDGFGFASLLGSQANDAFRMVDGRVETVTNHSGGIQGGITNGMPVVFRCCVRATPSISQNQDTISIKRMENDTISVHGRHDPCILARVTPVIEAVTAIGLVELLKERASCMKSV